MTTTIQEERLARMIGEIVPDFASPPELIASISDNGRAYGELAAMSDDELTELIELEAQRLGG